MMGARARAGNHHRRRNGTKTSGKIYLGKKKWKTFTINNIFISNSLPHHKNGGPLTWSRFVMTQPLQGWVQNIRRKIRSARALWGARAFTSDAEYRKKEKKNNRNWNAITGIGRRRRRRWWWGRRFVTERKLEHFRGKECRRTLQIKEKSRKENHFVKGTENAMIFIRGRGRMCFDNDGTV